MITKVPHLYLYPENLAEKASTWLWELKDLAVIGISLLLSIRILTQTKLLLPPVASALYAFLSMRLDGASSQVRSRILLPQAAILRMEAAR